MGDGDAGEGEEMTSEKVVIKDVWGRCGHCGYVIEGDTPDEGRSGYINHSCTAKPGEHACIKYGVSEREVYIS